MLSARRTCWLRNWQNNELSPLGVRHSDGRVLFWPAFKLLPSHYRQKRWGQPAELVNHQKPALVSFFFSLSHSLSLARDKTHARSVRR